MFKGIEEYCWNCGKYAILEIKKEECIYCGSKDLRHTPVEYSYDKPKKKED